MATEIIKWWQDGETNVPSLFHVIINDDGSINAATVFGVSIEGNDDSFQIGENVYELPDDLRPLFAASCRGCEAVFCSVASLLALIQKQVIPEECLYKARYDRMLPAFNTIVIPNVPIRVGGGTFVVKRLRAIEGLTEAQVVALATDSNIGSFSLTGGALVATKIS